MIKDTKGRKWLMRFKQYRQGWHWDALVQNMPMPPGSRLV